MSERVHPKMRAVYDEYLSDLIKEGMSEADAIRNLASIRDWSKNAFSLFLGLRSREDVYSESCRQRMDSAEAGTDIAEYWICLQSGGASETDLERFTLECELRSPQMILFWLCKNNLAKTFAQGRDLLKGIEVRD